MKQMFLKAWVLIAITTISSVALGQGVSGYTLGSGDQLEVQVYGEDDMTVEAYLSDTGTLSYPFLGELKVLGLTVGQLEALITQGLQPDYFIDPLVTVRIIEYRQFYINGEVDKPGGFAFQPGLTVRKAVSLAGGFTERASKSSVYVISDTSDTQESVKVKLNYAVKPGDIITIEQSFF